MARIKRDADRILKRATSLQTAWAAHFEDVRANRKLTRQQFNTFVKTDNTTKYADVRSARAFALLQQYAAFLDTGHIKVEVPQKSESAKEDKATTKLERFLQGVPDALVPRVEFVYRDSVMCGAEDGYVRLMLLFNTGLAKKGLFPFDVWVPDAEGFCYRKGGEGIAEVVCSETVNAGDLYDQLELRLGEKGASITNNKDFNLARLAETDPEHPCNALYYYDDEAEVMFVEGVHVWTRPHLMERVPCDVISFNGLSGHKPEERGMGLIKPVAPSLQNIEIILNQMAEDAELTHRPPIIISTPDGYVEIDKAKIDEKYKGTLAAQVDIKPNAQYTQMFMQLLDIDTQRATFPDTTLLGTQQALSGYAISQAQSGPNLRAERQGDEPEAVLRSHFSAMLKAVEKFATPQMADAFGADETDWMNSFSVLTEGIAQDSGQKRYEQLTLTADDVGGHYSVIVSLKPQAPSDKSALMQQYALAVQNRVPVEYAVRHVLEAENPDELLRLQKKEELKQNPVYGAMFEQMEFLTLLSESKETAKFWKAFCEQNGIDPETGQPLQQAQTPPIQPQVRADFQSLPPEAQAQQLGLLPSGAPQGLTPDMVAPGAGAPGMPSPAENQLPPPQGLPMGIGG